MLSVLNLGPGIMAPSRTNGFLNMLETMRKRTLMLTEQLPKFPSLIITGDDITPQGAFAKTQAQYLAPNQAQVDALVKVYLCHASSTVLHVCDVLVVIGAQGTLICLSAFILTGSACRHQYLLPCMPCSSQDVHLRIIAFLCMTTAGIDQSGFILTVGLAWTCA